MQYMNMLNNYLDYNMNMPQNVQLFLNNYLILKEINLQIKINDAVLKGGFPVIDRINNSARQLLVDYYSNCETTYIRGMKTILDDKNKEDKNKEDKKEDKKV